MLKALLEFLSLGATKDTEVTIITSGKDDKLRLLMN